MHSGVFPHHGHHAAKDMLMRCPLIHLEALFQEPSHYRVGNSGNWVDAVIQESCCALPFLELKMSLEWAVSCSGSAPAGWAQPLKGSCPLLAPWLWLQAVGRALQRWTKPPLSCCASLPFGTTSLMKWLVLFHHQEGHPDLFIPEVIFFFCKWVCFGPQVTLPVPGS